MSDRAMLHKAALLCTEASYNRKATSAALNPDTEQFSITGLIERASCQPFNKGFYPRQADSSGAKALLCRHLRAIHLDTWEIDHKPDAMLVKQSMLDAAREGAVQSL